MERDSKKTDLGNRGRRFRNDHLINLPISDEVIMMTPVLGGSGLTNEVIVTVRPRNVSTDRSSAINQPAGKAAKLTASAKRQAKKRKKA